MENQLRKASSIILNGGIVAYPTDTVYGIGADPYNKGAVERVYRIKERPFNQPLPLLIAQMSDIFELTSQFTEMAGRLAARFWPGGLTLVVVKSRSIPDWISAGGDTVAVRIPNHPLTLELIRSVGKPLIGTSANLSGKPSVVSAEDVRSQLGNKIDFIIDGGLCPGGIESTVVDVSGTAPSILREGAVSSEVIMEMIS